MCDGDAEVVLMVPMTALVVQSSGEWWVGRVWPGGWWVPCHGPWVVSGEWRAAVVVAGHGRCAGVLAVCPWRLVAGVKRWVVGRAVHGG